MIDKNDPLIGVVQGVMNKNHAEREAAKVVNEKFGIQDRKALPHERQHEWEAAYKTVLSEGVEALNEKSFAALAPPYDKATQKDRLVGAGVLKKHPTKPGEHVLAKEGSDVTSPSSMGIKKPDYAPAGTTPDYAKSKEQTPNRAAKTSLPPGTVAKSIKEAGPGFAGAGSQVKSQSTYGSGPRIGGNPTAAPAARPAMSGSQARTGGNPTAAPAARPAMSGSQARTGGNPTAAPAARPAVGGARPSVVAKNSYSGAQTSTGNQVGGARPSVVAKNSPSQKSYQSGAGAMTNPTQRPYDAKTSPTAKAPTQAGAKPVQKLKPVRKQPTTGTAKRSGVAAKPVKKLTPLQQQMRRSRTGRDGLAGPGNT